MESLILVDEHDLEIGTAEKLAVHEQGLLHRAFSVFVFRWNAQGLELLLQQRHHEKYHGGGLWTNTCCSHPRPHETVEEAAARRLKEEMGLTVPLEKVGQFIYRAEFENGLIEHEFDHVFIGFDQNEHIQMNPTEVMNVRWVEVNAVLEEYQTNLKQFTPWFKEALEIALEHVNA